MAEPLVRPWRPNTVGWEKKDRDQLYQYVKDYSPLSSLDISYINILMLGPVGSGKSSFFNTVNSVFRGHVTGQAAAGDSTRALTTNYRKYSVRQGKGGPPLKFRLCDTMGIEEEGLEPEDFKAILDGNIQDRFVFNPGMNVDQEAPTYNRDPSLSDKIHVTAFVIDASTISVLSVSVLEKLRKIRQFTNQRGIPLIVVMTKVDEVCEHCMEDLANVYHSNHIAEKVQEVADKVGIPKAQILVVKNYECETDLDEKIDILTLVAVRQMLRLADDYMNDQLDLYEDLRSAVSTIPGPGKVDITVKPTP